MGEGLDAARLIATTVLAPGDGPRWHDAPEPTRARALLLAREARLDLLLARSIARAGAHVPGDLAMRANAARAAGGWAWVEGSAVVRALEDGGFSPIALKGADLAARAYPVVFDGLPDRAYLRHATDLDLLVPNPDAAAPALRGLGYISGAAGAAHHRRWTKGNGDLPFSVELHGDLFDRPHGLALDAPALRARAVVVPSPDGAGRRVLAPLDAALHVAGHAVYSDLLGDPVPALRGPLDLAVLARATSLDGLALVEAARAARLAPVLGVALAWCAEVLEDALPASLRDAAQAMLPMRAGARVAWGAQRVLRGASAALDGNRRRAPATLGRALLAPTFADAAAMLLEGLRRRTRRTLRTGPP